MTLLISWMFRAEQKTMEKDNVGGESVLVAGKFN